LDKSRRVHGNCQEGIHRRISETRVSATVVAASTRPRAAFRPRREHELFGCWRAGDDGAREELIARFLPMAHRLARRYWRGAGSVDDLVQVASMGLVKAVERFDHSREVPFASYAIPTIVGELKRYLRDTSWAAHVPQRMRERALEVEHATERLRRGLGRSPTTDEVAREAEMSVDDVLEAAQAATAYEAVSLDAPLWGDDARADRLESLAVEEERFDLVEHGVTIEAAVRALPQRQRAILRLRFAEDMTQSEIAQALGISQMHVSRLLRQALAKLRTVAAMRQAAWPLSPCPDAD
jgi:RNA polymerase sigma-B factor